MKFVYLSGKKKEISTKLFCFTKLCNLSLETFVLSDFISPSQKKALFALYLKMLSQNCSEKNDESKKLPYWGGNFYYKVQIETCLSIWCDKKRKICAKDWKEQWTWSKHNFSRSHLMHHSSDTGDQSTSGKYWKA